MELHADPEAAREPNGVVQAVEDPLRRFWIGVQFHPELMIYRKSMRQLFRTLVEAARTRAAERLAEEPAVVMPVSETEPEAA